MTDSESTNNNRFCEYERCGGAGRKKTKTRWLARLELQFNNEKWHVCEGCAALLVKRAREGGWEVEKRYIPDSEVKPKRPRGKKRR